MSNAPDPFAAFETERTIVKPQPRHGASAPPPSSSAGGTASDAPPADLGHLAALNPLVAAATPLLLLAARLRGMVQPADAGALRTAAGEAVRRFDADARAAGSAPEAVLGARYVLCTAVDEAVAKLDMPVRLRLALEELGPTAIKLGQVLSTRADLVPEAYLRELSHLQDRVPPSPFEEVQQVISEELGAPVEEVFREFDPEPRASARACGRSA